MISAFAAASLKEPAADWRTFRAQEVHLQNPGQLSLRLVYGATDHSEHSGESFKAAEYFEQLPTSTLGQVVLAGAALPSTQNLMQELAKTLPDGTVCMADRQTAGRGALIPLLPDRQNQSHLPVHLACCLRLLRSNPVSIQSQNLACNSARRECAASVQKQNSALASCNSMPLGPFHSSVAVDWPLMHPPSLSASATQHVASAFPLHSVLVVKLHM